MEDSEKIGSPIDFERLREVCGDDAEMINEIVEMYFNQTSEQLDELKKVVQAQDFEAIYKFAHKIVGGSLTCGMNAIVPSIRELEQAGKNQNGESIEDLFEQAQKEFARMKEYLETNKEELTS